MKIVHIVLCCNSFNDGWNYQENCIPKYNSLDGHDVTVITVPYTVNLHGGPPLYTEPGEYIGNYSLKMIRLPMRTTFGIKIARRFRLYKGLYETLSKVQPDLIFIHGCQFLDIKYVVRYIKQHPSIKLVVDCHEDFQNSARNFISKNILHRLIWMNCAKRIEPYTKVFWGVLPARVAFMRDFYKMPADKCKLLVMGAEDERVQEAKNQEQREILRQKYGIKKDDFLVISGGKLDTNKPQVLNLMKAINGIDNSHIKFIFFGSVCDEYKENVKSLISERVQYIGWVMPDDTYKYFEMGDLVVFPGLHSVFWEQAVGLGKVCVFRHMEGFTHIDLGGNCEYLYSENPQEMADIISNLYCDKDKYNALKRCAEEKGMVTFSYRSISNKSIDV